MESAQEQRTHPSTAGTHSSSPAAAVGHNYAFLVHSTETLPNNLPPNVDNKPLARQKRRRTSPEDQAILENEYLRNPKPDKAARMDIVRRVALGEKEVQIWFQNRRQSSRRKSRPLLPHEVAAYQSSYAASPYDGASSESMQRVGEPFETPNNTVVKSEDGHAAAIPSERETSPETRDPDVTLVEVPSSQPLSSSQEAAGSRLGYLANRRSAPPPRPAMDDEHGAIDPSSQASLVESQELLGRPLKKAPSFVRISMTSEGNAKIITKDESSPSPPRRPSSPQPPGGMTAELRRSQSASTLTDVLQFGSSQGSSSGLRRKPSGRSRDSRAWEFWCDKDGRSELEEKADQETSGSAADAIGLIRSSSGRSILRTLSGKRSLPPAEPTSVKRPKTVKTPLMQTSSSFHNKQSPKRMPGKHSGFITPARLKKGASGLGIELPTTDSDKENWSPERQMSDNFTIDTPAIGSQSHTSVQRTPRSIVRAGKGIHKLSSESTELVESPEDDEETATFMARSRKSTSVSEEEELDCVQGLLSLSQGNWR